MNALHLGYVSQMLENVIRKAFLQFLKSGAATVWECSGRDWEDLNNSRRRPGCMTRLEGVLRFFNDDSACIRGPDFISETLFCKVAKQYFQNC